MDYFINVWKSCKPDRPMRVNLCHHLLSPTDGSVISHLPQSVVTHNIAHSKSGAGATLVEFIAIFRERETEHTWLSLTGTCSSQPGEHFDLKNTNVLSSNKFWWSPLNIFTNLSCCIFERVCLLLHMWWNTVNPVHFSLHCVKTF